MHPARQMAAASIFALLSTTTFAIPMSSTVGPVTVLGIAYNVDILYDSLGDYDSQGFNILNPAITFTTEADATAAVIALNATFPDYDWTPVDLDSSGTRVAYAANATDYDYMTVAFNDAPYGSFNAGRNDGNYFSFAQFTRLSNQVPEPFSLGLFGLALAGLRWSRCKAG